MTKLLVLGLLDGGPCRATTSSRSWAGRTRSGGAACFRAPSTTRSKAGGGGLHRPGGVEQTGHRQKAVYRITEAGRNHLHTPLIADALRASSALYPTTLYSALSLADKLPPAEVRLALEEQRRRLEAEYAALERGRAGNEGQEVPPLARITIDNMVDIVQRQRRCVEELLAAVGEAP